MIYDLGKLIKRLSIVMIVKNEESCLARCLDSVKGADEIIICDTGSTDKTIEIAKKYTNKVYTDYKWNDNFAEARNHAKSKATGDWILSIDADEVLAKDGMAEIQKAIQRSKINRIAVHMEYATGGWWWFPRLFKNDETNCWAGAIHNYLMPIGPYEESKIKIIVYSSLSHLNDVDRTLRILKKEVTDNPQSSREFFYLGREYIYRQNWIAALYWLERYINLGGWTAERADAFLFIAKALFKLRRRDEAKTATLEAIKINADFKEAIEFMAYISSKENKDRWLLFAESAKSRHVLLNRTVVERDADYYNELFANNSDMSRYANIDKKVAKTAKGTVLEIGCGTGELAKRLPKERYYGFDFSKTAVGIANHPHIWEGNAYHKKNYNGRSYDTYVALEVLEHVDDYKVLEHLPKGKPIIFSVPSFPDPSHLRFYTEESMRRRYEGHIDIKNVTRFNIHAKGWEESEPDTNDYILLVEGIRK